MPLPLQAKMLRLVQEKQFERVGGLATLTVDVRVVAATNRDLRAAGASRRFREDLYFRLSVVPIEIPPLRERRGDIPLLADAFLQRFTRELGRPGLRLRPAAREALCAHAWPGNVRELQNCLERGVILCDGPEILPRHLRLEAVARDGPELGDVLDVTGTLAEVRERAAAAAEEAAIALALREADGDRAAAAAGSGSACRRWGAGCATDGGPAAPGCYSCFFHFVRWFACRIFLRRRIDGRA